MWQSRKPALITHLEDNWRVNPALSGGGYFHDLSPHQLDLMLYFFGEPEYYSGRGLNQASIHNCDDNVSGILVFKNGVVVNGSWCFNIAEEASVDSCEIIGSEGSMSFPFFNAPHTIKLKIGTKEDEINFAPLEHVQQPLIEKVVNYFNGEGDNPSPIADAIVLMKMIDTFAAPPNPSR
jgi:predicted dehydrogenase